MKHHTKDKGDLGVLKAQVDLHKQGYLIFHPASEHAPFDLVVYRNGSFKRVQVKYKTTDRNGSLQVQFRSCWADKNGSHMKRTDKLEIDVYCIYCPDTDECYYFDPNVFNQSINLRVRPPKNNQTKFVKFAADYRRVP